MGMVESMPQQRTRNANQGRKQSNVRNSDGICDFPGINWDTPVHDVAQSNLECKIPKQISESTLCQPDLITCCQNVAIFLADVAASNSNDSTYAPPTAEYIYSYIRFLFAILQLEPEVCVYADIYCRRLLGNSRGTVKIHPGNWHRILVGSCLLASKYVDDLSINNRDFSTALTGCSVQFLNKVEANFVHVLNWELHVPISEYTKRYSELARKQDRARNWDVEIEKVKPHFTLIAR